jgi:DNA polymerase I
LITSGDALVVGCHRSGAGAMIGRGIAGETVIIRSGTLTFGIPMSASPKSDSPKSAPPKPRKPKAGDHIFLVDGSSYIFRAYFQSMNQGNKYNYRSDGLPTGGVRMFCIMLWRLLAEMTPDERPTHLAVVFDKSEKTFRTDLYPQYKAHRPDPPGDLVPQFALIRDAVRAFDIPSVEQEGFEADDLIATYARQASEAGATVTIVASDKDLMQLVGERVVMYDTMKDRKIGRAEVIEKFGVPPEKVIDVQALVGDSTDNVPGVPGIGVKTAAQLIGEYGDLDTLLKRAVEIKQEKRRQALIENAEQARLSRTLVTLDDHVALETPLSDIVVRDPDPTRLIAFLKAMEFNTLTRRVAEATGVDPAKIEPDTRQAASGAGRPAASPQAASTTTPATRVTAAPSAKARGAAAHDGDMTPQALATARAEAARAAKIDRSRYETVRTLDRLQAWIGRAREVGAIAIDTEATSLDPMLAELRGFSLAVEPNQGCYVPLSHRQESPSDRDGLFAGEVAGDQLEERAALAALKPLLEDASVLKVGQNVKFDWLIFALRGIEMKPLDDTMLVSYVLDAGKSAHGLDTLSEQWLGHRTLRFGEVAGAAKSRQDIDQVSIEKATECAAEDADVTFRLWKVLKPRLVAEHMTTVYEGLERPLVPVLARMERRGISIDRDVLSRLSGEFAQKAGGLEDEIRQLAGEPLNPGSPKQIGDVLFGKLGLPGAKKTKTGAWSTSASVLEDLAEEGHALPQKILEWRQVSKLKSTYTDALPGFVHPQTHRVHTSYALAATSTGRLSSSEPNLQNIPIRTEEGRKIRRAFIAIDAHQLVSADYSQIELRLLAEIADIAALKQAFRDGLDIHAMTASEMFGVPVKDMPGEVRRRAKAINFGIIYGISAFGLANQLGIPREEAQAYIKKYFERFPGIRAYMDQTREFCRKNGYVLTLFGRKCHYPDIINSNPSIRAFNERAAINARLQGTAADIIRRAMIHMEEALTRKSLSAQMLLQVHDELVFEVPDDEVNKTMPVVRKVMEDAPLPAISLSVPLRVDVRAASNWEEAH